MISRDRRSPGLLVVSLVATSILACATAPSRPGGGAVGASSEVELDNRATLLMLADRREFVRMPVDRALVGGPNLREELAVTLGRIGDPAGRPALEGLLGDEEVAVRRAAAFALGELGAREAEARLLLAVTDDDRETGTVAVEALGKLGARVEEVRLRLAALAEAEAAARLLPGLFRFREPLALEGGLAGLTRPEPALRQAAAYGIARYPRPEAAPTLRSLLDESDPSIRAIAARGLGEVGEAADLARLRALVEGAEDPADDGVAIQAMRAAARLVARGASDPDEGERWRSALAARFEHPSAGVRVTALEAAASFAGGALPSALAARFAAAETTRERELALLALCRVDSIAARQALRTAASSDSAALRAAAAQAAGSLSELGLLDVLARDASPRVRIAVLEARLSAGPSGNGADGFAEAALADADPAVRATALDWWTEHPGLPVERLAAAAVPGRPASELVDDRLAAVRALVARARATELERGACLAALDKLTRDASYLVRREAVEAFRGLGQPAPPLSPLETRRGLAAYRQVLAQTAAPRLAVMDTTRGRIVLELACPQAPLTCLSFLQLAEAGYFDGQSFHRVVPDFVVQGGDPRGDGWGGPGYALRDEINRLRYERGALGMALSGPDTGGSQFFLTLSPQPHLDGGYTVFGRLVGGEEVLSQIVQGDGILRVREARATPPGRRR